MGEGLTGERVEDLLDFGGDDIAPGGESSSDEYRVPNRWRFAIRTSEFGICMVGGVSEVGIDGAGCEFRRSTPHPNPFPFEAEKESCSRRFMERDCIPSFPPLTSGQNKESRPPPRLLPSDERA